MKKWAMAIAVAGIVGGCGGGKMAQEEKPAAEAQSREGKCIPYGVEVEGEAGKAWVRFKADCGFLISGYNVYVSREPLGTAERLGEGLVDLRSWNKTVFPGDTTPEDGVETFEAQGLEDGVRYYIHVRTVFADGTVSGGSEEVAVVPGPRGTIDLAIRYRGEQDGFSFARNEYVRADNAANDIYYYALDGRDYLASPSQLGFLRSSRFRLLQTKGSFAEATEELAALSSLPTDDRVAVKAGDWVQIMTEDKTFVLVQAARAGGTAGERKLTLRYVYSPAAGAPIF